MRKYLVLGSAGQIGASLVDYLRKDGHIVYTMDIVEDSSEDLRTINNEKLEKYIMESDFIFFLAFDVGGAKYLSKYQDTFDFIQNNAQIMSNTFQVLKDFEKPFIFASSQMSDMNHSTYGLCKAIGERYTNSLGGLNIKLWNVYGYEKDYEKSHVITDFILKAMNTGEIDMLTDGKEERQLLHVDDCCRAMHMLSLNFKEIEGVSIKPSKRKDMTHGGWRKEPPENILSYWSPSVSLKDGVKDIIEKMKC